MTRYLLAALLILLLGYGFLKAEPLLFGPTLAVAEPKNGASVPGGIVSVSGRSLRAAALTLDGAPLLPEADGRFFATLSLPQGGSILTLVATDRFGRSVTRTRSIYVP